MTPAHYFRAPRLRRDAQTTLTDWTAATTTAMTESRSDLVNPWRSSKDMITRPSSGPFANTQTTANKRTAPMEALFGFAMHQASDAKRAFSATRLVRKWSGSNGYFGFGGNGYFSSARDITTRWIWLVPS